VESSEQAYGSITGWRLKRMIAISLALGRIFVLLVISSLSALAQSSDESLTNYAVNINQTPQQPWPGYGIYLGRGLVITAAHVAGHVFVTKPKIVIGGQELPVKLIKEGNFDETDLTILSVDETILPMKLRLRRVALCKSAPFPGQSVIVVVPEGIARSKIVSPMVLAPNMRTKYPTLIRDVAQTGNSGSGVFDARKKCLMGIMSRKIQEFRLSNENGNEVRVPVDIAKYFVPAATIAEFLPAEYRGQ
jgi:hypothetical protein